MLRMVTGIPGHGKTSYMLSLFLQEKERPRFATHIEGLDYDKHGITKLDHLKDIFTLPPGSLVLCDEAQKFLRPRAKGEQVADWVTEFETHRHKGIDLWYITQHPMLIDTHVRRLTEEHWHIFRPFGMRRLSSVRKWEGVQENPNDYHAMQQAQVVVANAPSWVFNEYKSTVLDTNQVRFPRKLIYSGLALLLVFSVVAFQGYRFWAHHADDVATPITDVKPVPVSKGAHVMTASANRDKKITLDDFAPVSPLAPWTAPVYAGAARMVAVPRFAGCMASAKGCECVTQQGTRLLVDRNTCVQVVYGKSMPFDPFHADSRPVQQQVEHPAQVASVESPPPTVVGAEQAGNFADRPYQSIYSHGQ